MKVLLSVVSRDQVVEELLDAMDHSVDRFSQDRSFDFRLVRIDQFLVPPRHVERCDNACSSYSNRNPYPSRETMKPLLAQPCNLNDIDCLSYAAILYRTGNFEADAHWGACFYFLKTGMSEYSERFVRLDCRENAIERDGAPSSLDINGQLFLPGDDRFSLPWVLAWAERPISFEGQGECQSRKNPHRGSVDTFGFARDFHDFRSGLGEIDTLSQKARGNSDAKRLLRYGWARASMSSVRPSPFPGAGKQIERLFAKLDQEPA